MKFERMLLDTSTTLGFYLKTDIWTARGGKFSFIIAKNEIGYTASYKDAESTFPQSSQFLKNTGGTEVFRTLHQAETACRRKLRELKKN